MPADTVAIVEAAYRQADTDDDWLRQVGRAVLPSFDARFGVLAYLLDTRGGRRCTSRPVVVDGPEWLAGNWRTLHDEVNEAVRSRGLPASVRLYDPARCAATLSEVYGKFVDIRRVDAFRDAWMARGVEEHVVIVALDATGQGCALAVPLAQATRLAPVTRRKWQRVAAHLAAARRLRSQSAGAGVGADAGPDADACAGMGPDAEGTDAVLAADGRVVHARAEATNAASLAALRDAARRADRARGGLRASDPDEAVELWRALVAGRWSLVDHFESDGRRLILARRNDPKLSDPRALSERERAVIAYAAMGYSNKRIAYELGLGTSTIGNHLAHAMRKLGLRSRVELVRTLRTLSQR